MSSNVKTFRAASMPEALELVKREFGPDAVILGSRTADPGPLSTLLGGRRFEITAGPANLASPAPRLRSSPPAKPAEPIEPPRADGPENPQVAIKPAAGGVAAKSSAGAIPDQVYPFYLQLIKADVSRELARQILVAAMRQIPRGKTLTRADLEAQTRAAIAQLVPTSDGIDLPAGETRRVALIGPPGAGKSSTIAKIAGDFTLRRQRRVAILEINTLRPAGAESLQRYAETLEIPYAYVPHLSEVRTRARGLPGHDLLLIDTPGVAWRDEAQFLRLGSVLRAAKPDETHLVLPASMSLDCQRRMARAFAPLQPNRAILTRLDEVVGCGVILDTLRELNLAASYMSDGQNLSRDLREACGAAMADLVCPLMESDSALTTALA